MAFDIDDLPEAIQLRPYRYGRVSFYEINRHNFAPISRLAAITGKY